MADEILFDLASLSRAVQFVIDAGTASAAGEVLAQGFGERLEQILRNLARNAAQAAPTRAQLAAAVLPMLVASSENVEDSRLPDLAREVARQAYVFADAFIAAGETSPPTPEPEQAPPGGA